MMVKGWLEREVGKMYHLRRSQPLASAFKKAPKDKKNPNVIRICDRLDRRRLILEGSRSYLPY
jgi:hypothetical protein